MIDWLIAHNQELALLLLGGWGGVWYAAWRQLELERVEQERPVVYDWEERGI